MAKSFETVIQIGGKIDSSVIGSFQKASKGLSGLKDETRAVKRELDRLGRDFQKGKIDQSQYTKESKRLGLELQTLDRKTTEAAEAQRILNRETAAANRQLKQQAYAAKQRNKALLTDMKVGVGNAVGKAATTAKIAGIGGAAVATATAIRSVNVAADFEAQLSKVGSKIEATNQEMSALRNTALELGASTSLSASTTAIAMDELAAKGMNANQIIAAMPGIIAGAEASGEDLTLVSDVVTSAINSYNMSASEASKVADIMAMSAIKSAAGVSDLGYSFKYAAPIAKTLGVSLEELAASTGLLVDGGLAGEQAGTAIRMSLTRLSSPPKEAQKALKKLGITVVDSNKKFKSLATITEDWNKATKDLSDTQRVQYASTIFGTEASTAMISLFSKGADSIRNMTKELENSQGAAMKTSKVMKDNFLGAKEQMTGAFESAQVAFGTPILSVLGDTMNGISSVIENNIDNLESMGGAVARVLEDITAPISMQEPVKPKIEPYMDPDYAQKAMSKYAADLEKFELFKDMSGTDKVHYMLDETISTIENWVGGSGGEAMQSLFTEVGTLAGKAWIGGFKTSAKGAINELTEGNVAGALAMGATANALTGGLLLSGGLAGSKWALGKGKDLVKNRKARSAAASIVPEGSTKKSLQKANATSVLPKTSSLFKVPQIPTGLINTLSKVGKIAGRATIPLAVAGSMVGIATSDNKKEAVGSAAGGIAGGLGGAKLGAAIGTAIAPGIGTALGGALGGLVGSLGGSTLGSKSASVLVPDKAPKSAVSQAQTLSINEGVNTTNENITKLNTAISTLNTNFSTLAISTEASNLTTNMANLTSNVEQASGWIGTLQGIQPMAQQVIYSLRDLNRRINEIELPGGTSRRLGYE